MEATSTLEALIQKKAELQAHAGRLNPDGLKEFFQLVEKASSLRDANPDEAERLRKKASDLAPSVEKSIEHALVVRDRIKAKMMGHAAEAMETYSDVLKELAK
ncbi:MAG TPA: hypothetical protein VGS41_04360 [Chthonomonadales bacterium]|nr:hypothetical protein [Chthonomonadales bacterium]